MYKNENIQCINITCNSSMTTVFFGDRFTGIDVVCKVDQLFDFCGAQHHFSKEKEKRSIQSFDYLLSLEKTSTYDLFKQCIHNYQCCVPIWNSLLQHCHKKPELNSHFHELCRYYALRTPKYKPEFPIETILDLFIKKGVYVNYTIYGESCLSFLVKSNNLSLVKKFVEQYGAKPHTTNLLIQACNALNERQYHLIKEQKTTTRRITIEEMDDIIVRIKTPYDNVDVFSYLVNDLQLDVDEKNKGGMTPLIAACSEGSIPKVRLLLARHPDFRPRTNSLKDFLTYYEGVDCWTWAKRNPPVHCLLLQYKEEVRQTYTELLKEIKEKITENGTQTIVDGVIHIDEILSFLV